MKMMATLEASVDADEGDDEGAEGRRRHVADEVDERLGEAGEEVEGAAQDPQGHADEGRQHEPVEDDADAVGDALVEPGPAAPDRRRRESGDEGRGDLVGSRQVHRIAAPPGGFRLSLLAHGRVLAGEQLAVDAHAGFEVADLPGVDDLDLRPPHPGHVADRPPQRQREQERQHPQSEAPPRGKLLSDGEPVAAGFHGRFRRTAFSARRRAEPRHIREAGLDGGRRRRRRGSCGRRDPGAGSPARRRRPARSSG